MNIRHLSKRTIWGSVLALGVIALLVACGGASNDEEVVQQVDGHKEALHFGKSAPVSFAPSSLTLSLNPGSRQDVPLTLTTTKALQNARIVFVPDLRNAVTVTPETIPSLAAGQSTTVTLTFAPAVTDTRKLIAGVVLLFDKNATVSRPLPVKVSLVKSEVINGVSVPPEPPPELNNATLAGFDTNGNGVRDDVDRAIAQKVSTTVAFDRALVVARAYQRLLVLPVISQAESDAAMLSAECFSYRSISNPVGIGGTLIKTLTINTGARRKDILAKSLTVVSRATDAVRECN